MKRILAVMIFLIAGISTIAAQTTSGRLSGTVSGPDGALPGAIVTITSGQTGKSFTVTADDSGNFRFLQIEPGNYSVKITAEGFKTYVATDLKVDVAREYTLNPTLELGEFQETVTVNAGTDVITATTSQVTNTVSPQQILSLPLITRNPLSLTTLQPGVASNPFQNTSINGLRTTMTNITRDGISINDQFIRTNATDFAPGRPSVDDTGEFTLATTNQESDLGSGGAQIILVTPRGTKDFHGALFAYNRNSAFAANNFFNNRTPNNADGSQAEIAKKPPFRNRNQYGGKISGPMPTPHFGEGGPMFDKDKGFFFFAYEGIKDPLSARATRTILTPEARGGTFRFTRASAGNVINAGGISCPSGAVGSICTVGNILTFAQAQGFQGIPSTIDPTIQARILNLMPTTGNTTGGDSLNTTGYGFNRGQDTIRDTYTTRIDIEATEKDSFYGVYSYNKEDNLRPDVDVQGFDPSPDVTQYSANKTLTLAYRRVFSSNVFNEARWGIFTSEVPFARVSPYPSFFIGPAGTTTGTLAGLISSPDNVFLDQGRNNKLYSWGDNLSIVAGSHSLKFGGQYQLYKVNSYNDVLIVPNYIVGNSNLTAATTTTFQTSNFANVGGTGSLISNSDLATGNALLSILGGLINQARQGFNTTTPTSGYSAERNLSPFRNSNHSLYASDKWSIARGLTLTLGLRYELFPALKINNGLSLEPTITDPNNPAASLLAGNGSFVPVGSNAGKDKLYYKTDYNNFAPNVGFAYTPNFESGFARFLFGSEGKTVIRGGYSHIYGNDSIITSLNNTLTGNVGLGRTSNFALGPTGTTVLNDRFSNPLATVPTPAFIAPPRSFLQNNTSAQGFFGVANAVDPKLQIPKVEQYSFGIQREIFGNMAFELRYVGGRSNNLARGIELNEIDVISNGFLADFKRAQANLGLTGATTPFCNPAVVTGCQALTIFQSGGVGSAGRLAVGSGVTLATFISNLRDGTVANLAQLFVSNNLNNHPSLANPNAAPFINFYQNPNIGQIELFTNAGYYNYNSLQAEVRRRFSNGLYFQGNYTFSKNLTDTIGTSQALFEPYLQNNNRKLDKQRADFDQTHVFNFNGIYELPFGKGKMFWNQGGLLDKIVGGWQLSGIMQMSTGAPITFVDARGTLNVGGRSGRQTVNSTLTNDQIRALVGVFEQNGRIYYINPSVINPANGRGSNGYISNLNSNGTFNGQVFFNVEAGETGSLGRTLISGPKFFNVDLSLIKNIKFTENVRVQLRAEAFNALNHVNFFNNTQFASITSTTFGQITSAAAARQMQFAARFEF
ncbi:MAG: TonB-dependent receptor [Pyrinomonadaceae bacterium]